MALFGLFLQCHSTAFSSDHFNMALDVNLVPLSETKVFGFPRCWINLFSSRTVAITSFKDSYPLTMASPQALVLRPAKNIKNHRATKDEE